MNAAQDRKKWGERVRSLIERYGSKEATAVACGVNFSTIVRWALGYSSPSHLAQKKIEELEKVKVKS